MWQQKAGLAATIVVFVGKCYPGWRQFDHKCYWYFGGVATYATAYSFCKVQSVFFSGVFVFLSR